jgi:hypothetical protein
VAPFGGVPVEPEAGPRLAVVGFDTGEASGKYQAMLTALAAHSVTR